MNEKILVVDDEREIADLLSLYLESENFTVFKFYSAREALDCIQTEILDMAILDIMMPEIDGYQLLQKIRETYHHPVIMLTAKSKEIDKINGLTLGVDDYITKPFRPLEMVARVKAQLRRYKRYNGNSEPETDIITHSGLLLNLKTHECILNEKKLPLIPTEFSILQILCQNKGLLLHCIYQMPFQFITN